MIGKRGGFLFPIHNTDNNSNTDTSDGTWQPHHDWWDVETMVDTGVLEWNGERIENVRYAYVLLSVYAETELEAGYSYYTSDGAYYPNGGTHIWDDTKDKESSKGYKTRSVVVCGENRDVQITSKLPYLFIYFGDCHVTKLTIGSGTNSATPTTESGALEAIRQSKNTTFASNVWVSNYSMSALVSLQELDIFNTGLTSIGSYTFYNCYSLKKVDLTNIETCEHGAFRNCYNLTVDVVNTKITEWTGSDFYYLYPQTELIFSENTVSIDNSFSNLLCLKTVYIPASTKSTNGNLFNFIGCGNLFTVTVGKGFTSSLNISASKNITLASLLNLAENYADMTGLTAPVLTIGSTNLAKLSDEQKALFTAKNITLA